MDNYLSVATVPVKNKHNLGMLFFYQISALCPLLVHVILVSNKPIFFLEIILTSDFNMFIMLL